MNTVVEHRLFSPTFLLENTSKTGFILIIAAACFTLFLLVCALCLCFSLITTCCRWKRDNKLGDYGHSPDSFIYSRHMKGNVNLIKRYNDVKITPTGIDGPCRDEPDGAAAADTVRDKAETTQHQVTTDNDQNDNDNADNADNTTTGHLHRAVSEKSVKIEPLQRMKPTTPICQLLDQTPRLPRADPLDMTTCCRHE